jgi:hypothetical protein
MKIARLAGLALVAILAMSLIGASAASAALPSFNPGTANAFSTTSATSTLEAAGNTVTCAADTSTGEITGAMTVGKVTVKFTGCKGKNAVGESCTIKSNAPAGAAGEIITNTLHGLLGLILTSAGVPRTPGSDAGLLVLPSSGATFVALEENKCTKATKVTGSVAGLVEPVGTKQLNGTLIFTVIGGAQEIKELDLLGRRVEPGLNAFSEPGTESTTDTVKYEKDVEVT